MNKIKNKIDLMENLDDLEKYQGKWKNLYQWKKTGQTATGIKEYNSEFEANEAYKKQLQERLENEKNRIHLYDNRIIPSKKVYFRDLIYLGAIPVKD